MVFLPKSFDVELSICLGPNGQVPCLDGEPSSVAWHRFGNNEFIALDVPTRAEANAVIATEAAWIQEIEQANDWEAEYVEIIDLIHENFDVPPFDLGVRGAVFALNANGCPTGTCCNGGAFGGDHHEDHPLVAFTAPDRMVDLLVAAAKAAGAGLERNGSAIIVYGDRIGAMTAFARELMRIT